MISASADQYSDRPTHKKALGWRLVVALVAELVFGVINHTEATAFGFHTPREADHANISSVVSVRDISNTYQIGRASIYCGEGQCSEWLIGKNYRLQVNSAFERLINRTINFVENGRNIDEVYSVDQKNSHIDFRDNSFGVSSIYPCKLNFGPSAFCERLLQGDGSHQETGPMQAAELLLGIQIQKDCSDAQPDSCYGKDTSEKHQPLVVVSNHFFGGLMPFFYGLGAGLILILSGYAMAYWRVWRI
jgi:hypothetical protein